MNKRLEVALKPCQRRRLQKIRDHPPSPAAGRRAVCLLLSADGASSKTIALASGLSIDAITDIRRRWQRRRFDCLEDRPRKHLASKATPAYRRQLRKALRLGPLAFGYIHTVWSLERLDAHMKALTGIGFCKDYLRKLVRAEGFVYRRPKHTLKGRRDQQAFRKAQRQLNLLKRGLYDLTPTTNCGTPMPRNSTCILT
jgi:transposase